ncbi:hypothetical protein LPN04_00290 [Rugamonas sp. A1-17]|nr:hypothetical protein [Rugamonas sp. A1-17]
MPTAPLALRSAAGTMLTLLIAFAASLGIAGAIAFFALDTMPCEWFGSSFEGGCGYGAMFVSIAGGLLLPPPSHLMGANYSSWLDAILWWLGTLLLLVNAVMVYLVAKLYNQQPAVLALASVLVGAIGAAGVFLFLHTAGARKPAGTVQG